MGEGNLFRRQNAGRTDSNDLFALAADRYKAMIIGKGGVMVKEISQAARKELETATSKKVYLELSVETDPHWIELLG